MSARAAPIEAGSRGEPDAAPSAWQRLLRRARPFGFPVLVYLASRAAVLVASYFAGFMKFSGMPRVRSVRVFTSGESEVYRAIAEHGYPANLQPRGSAYAFSPLYPMLLRAADRVSPLSSRETAIVVSTVLGLAAALALWWVTRSMFGRDTADRAVLLFCFLPGAFVLSFAYPDSLLVVLAIVGLASLTRQMWVVAGIAGALATATRPAGLALVVCAIWAAVEAIRRRRDFRSLFAPVLAISGFVAFVLYAAVRTGEPDAWFAAQRGGWSESFDAGWHFLHEVVAFLTFSRGDLDDVFFIITAVTIVGGLYLLATARLPALYAVYTIAVLVPVLTSASPRAGSTVVVLAFPLVIAAARRFREELLWGVAATFGALMMLSALWLAWKPGVALP